MKQFTAIFALLLFIAFKTPYKNAEEKLSPLHDYSTEWDQPKYMKCNTAAKTNYLTTEEKNIIWILNMARMNPPLFGKTVVKQFPELGSHGWLINIDEYKSLLDTMQKIKPMGILYPDSLCWESAKCHAITAGEVGYVGHVRQSDECSKPVYYGECCDYGYKDAMNIVMHLLIDQGVASLGHRKLMLSSYFDSLGVSIQPHKAYGSNAVLDFH
jgi:hypothetical protein